MDTAETQSPNEPTETSKPEAAEVNRYDRQLAKQYVEAMELGKASYAAADELMQKLHDRNEVGTAIALKDGQTVTLVDNFAASNVAWKPAGVRRFDLKVGKPKKPRRTKKVSK